MEQSKQMTLEVGGGEDASVVGSYGISGALPAIDELPKGAQVRVVVTDVDGEVISTSLGRITVVAFKDHRDKYGTLQFVERQHRVKVVPG